MLFNSFEFLLFGALFFAAWPLLRRWANGRWAFLTVASFVFYGWWDWRFLLLIIGSGLIDYTAALAMTRWPNRRKLFLVVSLLGNIGSLGVFKYLDFMIGNVNGLSSAFGFGRPFSPAGLILPVGISFYTFQSMSYTIDVYRDQLKPTRNILHFFAYLSMFPQLVAGPIVRAADLLPQLVYVNPTTEQQRFDGFKLIVFGYFKKMVVADTVARIVNTAFETHTAHQSASYWWVIMTLFAFQIYCDFSGYSDIARGLAKWMGYEFPLNFDHPYIARSIREFWSRWHISLSTWFRDYVYIPLGGSRVKPTRAHGNMWATMVISGLWHGAAWTFVIWGALHAAYLSLERMTDWPKKLARIPGGRHVSVLIVYVLVLFSWVFFRAESFSQAGYVITHMADVTRLDLGATWGAFHVKVKLVMMLIVLRQAWVYMGLDRRMPHEGRLASVVQVGGLAVLVACCILLRGPGAAFIYFQF